MRAELHKMCELTSLFCPAFIGYSGEPIVSAASQPGFTIRFATGHIQRRNTRPVGTFFAR